MNHNQENLTARAAPILFVLLWSTGFIGTKYVVNNADPLTYLAIRMAMSYAGFWVTRRSGGVVFRHLDDLDAVFESDTCADLRQLICAFQPPPGL
ncbi:hypothetical protein ABIF91_006743 [Bradyrhizobium sp. USDA 241]